MLPERVLAPGVFCFVFFFFSPSLKQVDIFHFSLSPVPTQWISTYKTTKLE